MGSTEDQSQKSLDQLTSLQNQETASCVCIYL